MDSDKFCLRWNDFETNISTAFRELRNDQDFFDVTLACDDDQIQAHKIILSACSPFFKSILKRNPHEHPLLYLKGVNYGDLVAVLDFMYHGEVHVAQEELNTFLQIAEELKIKGLTQNSPNPNLNLNQKLLKSPKALKAFSVPKKSKPVAAMTQEPSCIPLNGSSRPNHNENYEDEIQEILPVKTESAAGECLGTNSLAAQTAGNQDMDNTAVVENIASYGEDFGEFGDYNDEGNSFEQRGMQDNTEENTDQILDTMIESIIVKRVHPLHGVVHECSVCNKVLKKKNKMQQHAEIHLKGFSHLCNYCGKNYKNRPSLKVHISTTHKQEKDANNSESILG